MKNISSKNVSVSLNTNSPFWIWDGVRTSHPPWEDSWTYQRFVIPAGETLEILMFFEPDDYGNRKNNEIINGELTITYTESPRKVSQSLKLTNIFKFLIFINSRMSLD